MSNKWQNRNEIGGILRKGNSAAANPEARTVDLLVFGYACKIFRDDTKAREIDQGKHLIPWMADANLKIDRYDVRGALYDLTPYEPPPGGYGNRLDYLSSDEQRAEQLCEEERYLYLYRNEQEEMLYQGDSTPLGAPSTALPEEELKRLQQESSGCDSTYNQVQFNYDTPLGPNRDENSSELGADSEADKVFCLPKNFEVPPSLQLPETMKQHAIIEKTARFISAQGPQMEILIKAKQSNNQQFDFLTQNNTLNPYYKFVLSALKSGTYPEPESETPDPLPEDNATANSNNFEDPFSKPYIPVPTIKYTPSANCAYTQLISKIKGVPLPPPEPEKQPQSSIYTPVLLQQNATTQSVVENGAAGGGGESSSVKQPAKVEIKNLPNALMLAHYYSSDTDNEGDQSEDEQVKVENKPEPELCFPIPPDYLQNIIDKTAGYVIKNGRQFEETLRIKNDERFTFLFPDNEFYSYYMYKVTGEVKSYVPNEEDDDEKQKIASGPVSFSIKAKDEQPVSVIRPALPQEASDDESENKIKSNGNHLNDQVQLPQQQPARSVPEHVQKAIQLVESQLMARNAQLGIPTVTNRSRFDIDHTGTVAPKLPTTPSVLLTVEESPAKHVNSHQKELKRAEEKVKDKLAQIAREKLGGLLSKEKQLQIERKKKAMAFLNQIKGTSQSNSSDTTKFSTKTTTEDKEADDSDTSSVHSIPISSYGDDRSETELCNNPSNNNAPHEDVHIATVDDDDDDDDVQLVTTIITKRRHSRSHTRQRVQSPEVVIISPKRSRSRSRHSESRVKRSKSKSHKSKKKSSKRSHHHSKKKSKKRSRSHSTYRSHSCYSDDDDDDDGEEVYSSSDDSSSRKRRKRSASHKKKKSRRHDR